MKYTVLAVGRIRPPFADDVAHYAKLLAGHAQVDLVEVREDEQVERRIPDARLPRAARRRAAGRYDSVAFARWLEERRQGGPRRLLRDRRAVRDSSSSAATSGSRSGR